MGECTLPERVLVSPLLKRLIFLTHSTEFQASSTNGDATDAARSSADIILTEGLSVIISVVLTSRAIFQRMKNYTIYAVSITIRIVLGFMLLALIWRFDFSPFLILVIALLNDGTIMTIAKDRVEPSPYPDCWGLNEIFATGLLLGSYLGFVTVIFFWLVNNTMAFEKAFNVSTMKGNRNMIQSAVYLQVSIISQALIFVTRPRSVSFMDRPGILLITAFSVAQLIATLIAVYANWEFAESEGIGWGWVGVIWLFSFVTYLPLGLIKIGVRVVIDRMTAASRLAAREKQEKLTYLAGKEDKVLYEFALCMRDSRKMSA